MINLTWSQVSHITSTRDTGLVLSLHTTTAQRRFESMCLGLIDSRLILPCGDDEIRPIMLVFACSEAVFRPFMANVYERRPLVLRYCTSDRSLDVVPVTLLKSAGYELAQQTIPGREGIPSTVVGTFYTPNAFNLEPSSEGRCDFVMLASAEQLAFNAARLDNKSIAARLMRSGRSKLPASLWGHFGALACLWAGYVDRRVHAPMLQEPAFFAYAFYDALAEGLCRLASDLRPSTPKWGSCSEAWNRNPLDPTPRTRTFGMQALGYHNEIFINHASETAMQALLARAIGEYTASVSGCAKTETQEVI